MGYRLILRRTVWMAAWGVGLSLTVPALAQLGTTQIIAQEGDAAADGNGTILSFATNPALNDAGQVAYIVDSYLGSAGGTLDNTSINLFSGGVNQIISREGDAAPDANGVQGGFFSGDLEGLGSGGAVMFSNQMTGTAGSFTDDFGIFQGTTSGVTQLARELSVAPVATGDWDNFNTTMSVGGASIYGFSGDMSSTPGGTADDNFVARAIGGTTSIVTREGDAIPVGTGTFFIFNQPYANASGQMTFSAVLSGTTGGTADDLGLFRVNVDGSETQLAREGAAAPDGNGTFSFFSANRISSSGRAAFLAGLTNTAGGLADDFGVFTSSTGFVTQIAREGDTAPDGNGTFAFIASSGLTINDSNQVAFSGTLIGTADGLLDDKGIFVGSGGSLTQIVREGQPAPDGNGDFLSFVSSSFSMNNLGIVAAEVFLTNTSGGTADDNLLALADGIDTVIVAREGDALAGSTITSLGIDDSTSTQSSSLNEKGQLVYWASLANGDEVISVFTPDVHWRSAGSGSWSSSNNWTLGIKPDDFYDVLIDPSTAMTVTGPTVNTTVKSFTLGGAGSAVAILRLNGSVDGDLASTNAASITSAGQLVMDNDRTFSAPTLSNSGIIRGAGGSGTIDAVLTNQTVGQVRLATGEALMFNQAGHTNAGLIEVIGGSVEFSGSLTNAASTGLMTGRDATMRFTGGLTNNGALAVSFGTSDVHGDIGNSATGSVVVSGNANVTFYDDIANSGVINVATGSTAVFFGALTGNGVGGAGTVFLEGDTRPGFSPGVMSFGGDVHMGFFHSLTTELGGLTAGSEFDQLAVSGDVSLGGTLDVAGFGGFTLSPGMAFDLITFGGNLTGAFNNIVNSTGLAGLILNVTSDTNSVNLVLDGLAGDLNLDGFVGIEDLNLVLGNWNQNVTAGVWQLGEPTGDGFVGIEDLNQVLGNWNAGTPPPPGAVVPEPGTAVLLGLGAMGVLNRKRCWAGRRR